MARKKRRVCRKPSLSRIFLVIITFIFVCFSSFLREYFPAPILSEDTSVHFIDVGQGDSILCLSGGEAVLVDAGAADYGEEIVSYLTSQGVTELRAVIATHPHADHIGGMSEVMTAFDVEAFYTTESITTTWTYENMLNTIEARNIPMIVPKTDDILQLDSGATFEFLSSPSASQYKELNNASLVCMFQAGDSRVLLMGDSEKKVEEDLLRKNVDVSCDVIKLGHHGSHSSSGADFLKTTHARTAIISCGVDNSYGHPHKKTLENLNAAVIRDVRNTADDGTIVITFPKNTTDQKEDAA